jgi:hypothetical protein
MLDRKEAVKHHSLAAALTLAYGIYTCPLLCIRNRAVLNYSDTLQLAHRIELASIGHMVNVHFTTRAQSTTATSRRVSSYLVCTASVLSASCRMLSDCSVTNC